ncbi:MAG: futalosine hydrolase [Deltaproteobacteria bacterium]|nr:MAG: futalosine hydrolase [Deltaproteobacteria bacterium]
MTTEGFSPCLALVAALPNEGRRVLSRLRGRKTIACGRLDVLQGTLVDREVIVAFSGLGKVNSAATVAAILTRFAVSRLWMWGSAGAYPHPGLELTNIALASEEILGDEGVVTLNSWQSLSAIGIPLAETEKGPVFNRIPVDQAELERALRSLRRWQVPSVASQVLTGPFVTVCGVSGTLARARLLGQRFGALCENMEGAAAAHVCLTYGVPFLELRGLSNWAGDRDKRRWQLEPALDNCQRALLHLIETWNDK